MKSSIKSDTDSKGLVKPFIILNVYKSIISGAGVGERDGVMHKMDIITGTLGNTVYIAKFQI